MIARVMASRDSMRRMEVVAMMALGDDHGRAEYGVFVFRLGGGEFFRDDMELLSELHGELRRADPQHRTSHRITSACPRPPPCGVA